MTRDEAIKILLDDANDWDQEEAHMKADGVLLAVLESNGFKDVADAYRDTRTRVGFWYA